MNRNFEHLKRLVKANISKYINETLPLEYQKCLVGLDAILTWTWDITNSSSGVIRISEHANFNTTISICYSMASRKVTVVTTMLLAMMIAINAGSSFFTSNNAIAKMTGNMTTSLMRPGGLMGMGPGMMIGNQNQSTMMMQMMGSGKNITGSINLFSTISNAIETQVKVSLSDAASAAEGAVGNNSHAVAAHIGVANGYLIYCVWVLGPEMNMNMVIVDPGNGQVLSNMQISLQHLMMMGMGPGMMNHDMGMMGPGMTG